MVSDVNPHSYTEDRARSTDPHLAARLLAAEEAERDAEVGWWWCELDPGTLKAPPGFKGCFNLIMKTNVLST